MQKKSKTKSKSRPKSKSKPRAKSKPRPKQNYNYNYEQPRINNNDDLFNTSEASLTTINFEDMSKEGILEYLKNKLLQNILNTRYTYLSWFNRFNRSYQFMDFLTSYIKYFLQLNNYTVNEIYLYIRNNNMNSFLFFNDHIFLKNKLLLLRDKLVNHIDKFIINGTPPSYYTDLDNIFLPSSNKPIYILNNTKSNKLYDMQKEIDKLKNVIPTYQQPPPQPYQQPQQPYQPPPVFVPKPPPATRNERHARAAELGIVDQNTGQPTPGNEGLYNDILTGVAAFKNKEQIIKTLDSIFD